MTGVLNFFAKKLTFRYKLKIKSFNTFPQRTQVESV